MQKYILKRVLQFLPTVLVIVIVTWGLIRIAPGDPALALAGEMATPEMIEALRSAYGLNKPLYEQLAIYLTKVFQGDLGYSLTYGVPVMRIIMMRIPATLLLMLSANVLSFGIGVPLGAYLGSKYPSRRDSVISSGALVSYSVPIFFLGLLLITIFGFYLRWFPLGGMISILDKKEGWSYIVDVLWHATLPILTLTIVFLPQYLLVTRAGVIEIMQEDFIKTARNLGLSERSIYYKHALRNALISVITLLGIRLSLSLTGAIMTETVFAWPGMGKLLYDAITARDYPLLSGLFLFSAILVVVMSLITDIITGFLDPQVRLG
jgi:peptide/nickel transport system permease protein